VSDNTEDLNRSGIVDLSGDVSGAADVTWFGGDEFEESPSHFLEAGDQFVASRTRGAVTVPVIYDVETGEARELDFPAGVANVTEGRLADDRLLAYRTTSSRRPELVAYDLASDATETVLDAEYGPFAPDDFVEPRRSRSSPTAFRRPRRGQSITPLRGVRDRGTAVRLRPPPSPLIVNPHGGPRHRDSRQFSYRVQFLLARGYSVLQVNYRGSTGRGREFVEELYDDWGGAEQGDVATGVEHVLNEYDWLDEDRVAVYGGSYGGYSANWQMVQYPDLYAAGIAWVGVSDLFDMYENTMPHFRTELMVKNLGEPDENEALYRERSPVTHVENLDAPLLIVHGVNDPRVPVSQPEFFGTRSTTPASRRASTTSTRSSARRATVPATSTRRSGRWNCSTTSSTAGSARSRPRSPRWTTTSGALTSCDRNPWRCRNSRQGHIPIRSRSLREQQRSMTGVGIARWWRRYGI